MIKLLTIKDVGRWVEYTPSHGGSEVGRIKSWNDKWIFVVYNCANQWKDYKNYTAAATLPEDLTLLDENDNRIPTIYGMEY